MNREQMLDRIAQLLAKASDRELDLTLRILRNLVEEVTA